MIDKASVSQRLSDLAERVEGSDDTAAQRLRTLSTMIENDKDIHRWEVTDLHHLINPDGIIESYREHHKSGRWITILEIVRNTFILLPITVTWIAIWQATSKYNDLIQSLLASPQPERANLSFLYLWQDGFNNSLPDWLRISNVARLDFILLSIILVFTFLAYLLSNLREHSARALYTDLIDTLGQASFYLSVHRLTSEDQLERVARQIDTMAKDTLASMKDIFQETTAKYKEVTLNLSTELADISKEAAKELQSLSQGLTVSFEHVSEETTRQFEKLAQGVQAQLQAGTAYIEQLGQLTGGTDQLRQDLQAAASGLQSSSQDIDGHILALTGITTALSAQQKDLSDAVKVAGTDLSASSSSLAGLNQKQEALSSELNSTFVLLKAAVEQISSFTTSMQQNAQGQADFLEALKLEREAQSKQTTQVLDSTATLKNALEGMNEGAVNIRNVAIDMNSVLRLQAAIPRTLKSDLLDIVEGYTKAARTIEASAATLNTSAQAINNALPNLGTFAQTTPILEELTRSVVALQSAIAGLSSSTEAQASSAQRTRATTASDASSPKWENEPLVPESQVSTRSATPWPLNPFLPESEPEPQPRMLFVQAEPAPTQEATAVGAVEPASPPAIQNGSATQPLSRPRSPNVNRRFSKITRPLPPLDDLEDFS